MFVSLTFFFETSIRTHEIENRIESIVRRVLPSGVAAGAGTSIRVDPAFVAATACVLCSYDSDQYSADDSELHGREHSEQAARKECFLGPEGAFYCIPFLI